jgi:hypothetical protein
MLTRLPTALRQIDPAIVAEPDPINLCVTAPAGADPAAAGDTFPLVVHRQRLHWHRPLGTAGRAS